MLIKFEIVVFQFGSVKNLSFGKWLKPVKPLSHDRSNFEWFTDDISSVNQNMKFAFHKVEDIVGKGENASY